MAALSARRIQGAGRRWTAVIALAALVTVSCGGDDDDEGGSSATSAAATSAEPSGEGSTSAPAGDGGEVVVGAVLEPTNLDLVTQAGAALDQILLDNVYETLLKATAEGEVEAGLTDLPEISDDGLVYTFTIPEGVRFHSGEPLTSADVVWSLDAQRAEGANQFARAGVHRHRRSTRRADGGRDAVRNPTAACCTR